MVEQEKLVWNPVENKLCRWIDVNKLNSVSLKNAVHSCVSAEKNKSKRDTTTTRIMKPSRRSLIPEIADRDVVKTPDPPEDFRLNSYSSARLSYCRVTKSKPIKVSFNEGCYPSLRKATNIAMGAKEEEAEKSFGITYDPPALPKK